MGMRFQPGVAFGEVMVGDDDVRIHVAPHHARAIKRVGTPMVASSHAPQHGMSLSFRVGRIPGGGQRFGAQQLQQLTFEEDRVAGSKHCHPPHGTAVDVHPAGTFAQLQPDAAAVHAELHPRFGAAINGARATVGIKANGMHARCQHQVEVVTMGEAESWGSHVRGI